MFGFGKKKNDIVVETVCAKIRPLFGILELRLGALPTELIADPYVLGYVVGAATIFTQIETSGKASTELRGLVALASIQTAFAPLGITVQQASVAMRSIYGSDEAKRGSNAADLVIGVTLGKVDRDNDPEIVAAKAEVANLPTSMRQALGDNDRSLLMNELLEQVFFAPIEARYGKR